MSDLVAPAEREVRARHAFFVDWFAGRATEAEFAAATAAFAPDMWLIGPDGVAQDRAAVLAMLRAARAARPDLAIAIVMGRSLPLGPDHLLATYDEHQRLGDRRTARRSTAVFARAPAAPEGVAWLHLHETWINDNGED